MDRRTAADLDRYITGNYGEDQLRDAYDDADDKISADDLCEVCKVNQFELVYAGAQMCTPCRDEADEANSAVRDARRS